MSRAKATASLRAAAQLRGSDLTAKEQTNVRTVLKFLRFRFGGKWVLVAKALRINQDHLRATIHGASTVSASIAIRVARLVGAPVDDVLTGRFPSPGACPYCGACMTVQTEAHE